MGTLLAIFVTTCVYLLLLWTTGSTTLRNADGINLPQLLIASNTSELLSDAITSLSSISTNFITDTPALVEDVSSNMLSNMQYYVKPECAFNDTCKYGLLNYFQVSY